MMTFKDINHVSTSPKIWTAPNGRRIEWRSDRQPFDAYFAALVEYYGANNLGGIDSAVVQDAFCRQMPKWACVGSGYHTSQSLSNTPPPVTRGCSSCGKRR